MSQKFYSYPGARIGTRLGEAAFDEQGVFETDDEREAEDVSAFLDENPAWAQKPSKAKKGDADPEAGAAYEGVVNAELRAELESRGLDSRGNRADLVARLVEDDAAMAGAPSEPEATEAQPADEASAEAGVPA